MENNSIKDRLSVFIRYKNLSKYAFEKSIGVSNGFFNSINKSIGSDKLGYISKTYPDLNIDWLLTGDGEMLKAIESKDEISIRKYCLEKALERHSDPKDIISASIMYYKWLTNEQI